MTTLLPAPSRRAIALAAMALLLAALALLAGGAYPGVSLAQTGTDYDTDDDGLIEVDSLAKLNAIRYDTNGDGQVSSGDATNYAAGFPNFNAASCPDGPDSGSVASYDCTGYELTADLDFAGSSYVSGSGWAPLPQYTATFDGKGHTISNLTINRTSSSQDWVGLFSGLSGTSGIVRSVGLINPAITASALLVYAGALVGNNENGGQIYASYVTGGYVTTNSRDAIVGGLVGRNDDSGSTVIACYAYNTTVRANHNDDVAGGLVGGNYDGAIITASYAASAVHNPGIRPIGTGGLVGGNNMSSVNNSYYDSTIETDAGEGGAGQTTTLLTTTSSYTSIYAAWNVNVDGQGGNDDPWDFGANRQYPALRYGYSASDITSQHAALTITDYDADNDGLIEIDSLAKLNAIRYDADGNGAVAASNAANYAAGFPNFYVGSCPDNDNPANGANYDCTGYELTADLDFDTDDDGSTHTSGTGDAQDTYYNGGAGWTPLGGHTNAPTVFTATFEGNNHTIANLFINLSTTGNNDGHFVGLFGDSTGIIRNVGLVNPYVSNTRAGAGTVARTGALAARNRGSGGRISNSYVSGGEVKHYSGATVTTPIAGCLVGYSEAPISDSWASCAAFASKSGSSGGAPNLGGLVGWNDNSGTINNSYATGTVSAGGSSSVVIGGFVGNGEANITSSYATGNVTSTTSHVGGYIGGFAGAINGGTSHHAIYATGAVESQNTRDVGGLVGYANLGSTTNIAAVYATGAVSRTTSTAAAAADVGGLIGQLEAGSGVSVSAAYATGNVTKTASGGNVGGLVGGNTGANSTPVNNSYWSNNQNASAVTSGATNYSSQTAANLRTPTGYTGIYANWNLNLDGNTGNDDPWHFGTSSDYPILQFGRPHFVARQLAPNAAAQDYDADDDNLIDVATLAQLNAIRYDADGDGADGISGADATAYAKAFPGLTIDMGCPAAGADPDCNGYELTRDLDFDTDRDGDVDGDDPGSYANWVPLPQYSGVFDGKGHAISNLRINRSASGDEWAGLFSRLNGGSAVIRSLGLIDPDIDVANSGTSTWAGGLAGRMGGGAQIQASYVRGGAIDTNARLVWAGGLVGRMDNSGTRIIASYARGTAVTLIGGSGSIKRAGGLVGSLETGSNITASYAASRIIAPSGGSRSAGGLVGRNSNSSVSDSYFDSSVHATGVTNGGTARTTTQLQEPTEYGTMSTDIYQNWNVNLDGQPGNDDPWDFVSSSHYPILKYQRGAGGLVRQTTASTDYDTDDDGLIEIDTLAELDAVRHDLDADGIPPNTADALPYLTGFPGIGTGMCPSDNCKGYELTADLDFDENGDGEITSADAAYWNNGAGWIPIGDPLTAYHGDFHGNGHAIRHLFVNPTNIAAVGLFGAMWHGTVERVALLDVNLTPTWNAGGDGHVGALVGHTGGNAAIRYSYATGEIDVTASGTALVRAGGLVGQILGGNINASWADVDVDITSASTRALSDFAGGLVGRIPVRNFVVTVSASYATGEVTAARTGTAGRCASGGLIGETWASTLIANYAAPAMLTCTAPDGTATGGLIGTIPQSNQPSVATAGTNYWDNTTYTSSARSYGVGKTTAQLQPTDYSGDFATWDDYDVDNADGDGNTGTGADAPWHFASGAYPILKFGYDAVGVDRQQGGAGTVDYDADDDNLIDLGGGAAGLARLDAVRHDLDGDGLSVTGDGAVAYAAAFSGLTSGMGCPAGCTGYELTAHLDFDENGDDAITSADAAYWNGGSGWDPIGNAGVPYNAKFDGNGYVIDHLFISRSSQPFYVGLFGFTGENAELSNIGLPNVNVTGNDAVGALAGTSLGPIAASWSSGAVSGRRIVGGLAGQVGTSSNSSRARLVNTYSSASVSATGPDNPGGAGPRTAGGLVGRLAGSIATSYAAGAVTPTTGTVMGGGLAGFAAGANAAIAASHWDTQVTGQSASTAGTFTGGTGLNTAGMQSPTMPGALGAAYAGWDANVWDFGASDQYPVLKYTGRSLAWQGRGGFAWTQNAAAVTALSVDEDPMGSATYQVALAVAPEDDVAVTITPGHADVTIDDNNDGTFTATGTLTFTTANWNTPQDLILRAADDPDVGNIDTALALTAANAGAAETGYDGVTGMIDVTVQDDDTAAITLSVSQLAMSEEGTDGTYTVVLSNEPAADVTVSVVSDDTTAIRVSPTSLTFNADTTQSNPWNTAQTVTVTAPDDGDDDNENVTLTHTGADATVGSVSGYAGVSASLAVAVTDNDIPNIFLDTSALTLSENGTGTYAVDLTVLPDMDVTVTITATGATIDGPDTGSDFTASETLTFSTTDWNVPQTVTVQAPSDNDDLADSMVTLAHRATSTGSLYTGKTASETVTITNTETGSIVLSPLPPATLSVTEGASATYTVGLSKRPAADATVTITSSDTTALTANPSTLTFTRAGWSAARTQTVTVTAAADSNDDDDDYVLTNAGGGAGSGYESISAALTATVLDITSPGVALSPNDASRALNQLSGVVYTVTLDAEPAAEVTVAIVSNDPVVLVSASSLTFTPGNYNTAQSVSVSAAVDADGYHNAAAVTFTPTMRNVVGTARTLAVVANAPAPDPGAPAPQTRITPPPAGGGAAGYTVDSQTVTVTSNAGVPDGITISTTQALTADLTITLSAPAANVPARGGGFRLNAGSIVDITLSEDPAGGLEVCLPRGRDAIMLLRYQDGTWVEVPGSQVKGDQVCAVITQFSVFGAGRRAGAELLRPADNIVFGEGRNAQITVLVQDTTTEDVQVSWAVSAPDGGATPADFGTTTPLDTFPTGSITIPAGSDQTATISIPIYDDDKAEGAEPFTVRLTQATGGVADYNDEAITARIALSDPSLDLHGSGGDDDGAALTASSRLVIIEGRTNAYTMALSTEPAGPVTVVIHSNHDSVTTSPASLTFTPANFATPQQVTVNAAQDGDAKNEQSTLTHILTDADGAVIEIIDQLSVFVADLDPPDDDDVC